jgi:hypothetical protein
LVSPALSQIDEEAPLLRRGLLLALAALLVLSVVPYLPFVPLPFISDDYTQIYYARQYIRLDGWQDLAADPLYRCRATSLVVTRIVDAIFGLSPVAHSTAGVLMHAMNTWMLFALGMLPRIGWRLAFVAAAVFAVHEGHQEAVVWIAAQHELLNLLFVGVSFLAWHYSLQRAERRLPGARPRAGLLAAAGAVAAYVLALYSKESAVALLPALAVMWLLSPAVRQRHRQGAWMWQGAALGLMAVLTAVYMYSIFQASASHQHLNDGTFTWRAPFWVTLPNSLVRMLWFWGLLGMAAVGLWGGPRLRRLGLWALGWMGLALLPYSFLTYMTRVPSRHTYLASAGLAVLIAAGLWTILRRARSRARLAAAVLASMFLIHNTVYLAVKKLPHYERRSRSTERFLTSVSGEEDSIVVRCAPYSIWSYRHALAVVKGGDPMLVSEQPRVDTANEVVFCDEEHP